MKSNSFAESFSTLSKIDSSGNVDENIEIFKRVIHLLFQIQNNEKTVKTDFQT